MILPSAWHLKTKYYQHTPFALPQPQTPSPKANNTNNKEKKVYKITGNHSAQRSRAGFVGVRGVVFWPRDALENRQKRAIFNGFRTIGERPFRFRNTLDRSCQYNCHYVAGGVEKWFLAGPQWLDFTVDRLRGYRGRETRPFAAGCVPRNCSLDRGRRICGKLADVPLRFSRRDIMGREKRNLFVGQGMEESSASREIAR